MGRMIRSDPVPPSPLPLPTSFPTETYYWLDELKPEPIPDFNETIEDSADSDLGTGLHYSAFDDEDCGNNGESSQAANPDLN